MPTAPRQDTPASTGSQFNFAGDLYNDIRNSFVIDYSLDLDIECELYLYAPRLARSCCLLK